MLKRQSSIVFEQKNNNRFKLNKKYKTVNFFMKISFVVWFNSKKYDQVERSETVVRFSINSNCMVGILRRGNGKIWRAEWLRLRKRAQNSFQVHLLSSSHRIHPKLNAHVPTNAAPTNNPIRFLSNSVSSYVDIFCPLCVYYGLVYRRDSIADKRNSIR